MSAFIRVVPKEVEQHGPAAAIVLAHIRYRCDSDGPGRIDREGHRWWRVSHQALGKEIGLSRKAVMAALKLLGDAVPAKHFPPAEDQSRAYRVALGADALTSQSPDSDSPDQPESGSGQPPVPNGTPPSPDPDSALLVKTLKKEGRSGGSRPAAAPTPSSQLSANGKPTFHPRCSKHIHAEHPPACVGCKNARIAAEEFAVAEQARADDERRAITHAIDSCPDCDQFGRLDDLKDCPRHPNFRQRAAVNT